MSYALISAFYVTLVILYVIPMNQLFHKFKLLGEDT